MVVIDFRPLLERQMWGVAIVRIKGDDRYPLVTGHGNDTIGHGALAGPASARHTNDKRLTEHATGLAVRWVRRTLSESFPVAGRIMDQYPTVLQEILGRRCTDGRAGGLQGRSDSCQRPAWESDHSMSEGR